MNLNRIITSAAIALAFAGTGCSVEQPSVGCPVQRVSWAAKYTLVTPGGGSCDGLKGELIGIQRYNDPLKPTGAQKVALRPVRLVAGESTDPASMAKTSAVGDLSQEPTNDFCTATNFTAASQTLAGGATTYEFSDVKFYVTPAYPGSQFTATLKYTEGACTATYKVDAVWPPVDCDAAAGTGCEPGSTGPIGGTQANPDFALECRTLIRTAAGATRGYCVPSKDVPSLL